LVLLSKKNPRKQGLIFDKEAKALARSARAARLK
jgi:hypothetical protein